jgi:hypothetical protein
MPAVIRPIRPWRGSSRTRGFAGGNRRLESLFERSAQISQIERLQQQTHHPALRRALFDGGAGHPGHVPHADGSSPLLRLLTQVESRLEAVHQRHVDIDQRRVERRQTRSRQSSRTGRHTRHLISRTRQHGTERLEYRMLIVDDEHLSLYLRFRNGFHG